MFKRKKFPCLSCVLVGYLRQWCWRLPCLTCGWSRSSCRRGRAGLSPAPASPAPSSQSCSSPPSAISPCRCPGLGNTCHQHHIFKKNCHNAINHTKYIFCSFYCFFFILILIWSDNFFWFVQKIVVNWGCRALPSTMLRQWQMQSRQDASLLTV